MLYAKLIGWRSLNLVGFFLIKYFNVDTLFKDIVVWRKVLSFLIGRWMCFQVSELKNIMVGLLNVQCNG